MPTGAKVILILSLALLPLALIALFATLQTSRVADVEMKSRLRVAASEASRALAIELVGDTNALRVAQAALDGDANDSPSCARVQGVFAQQLSAGARFEITGGDGRLLCGSEIATTPNPPTGDARVGVTILGTEGLALDLPTARNGTNATAYFPRRMLADIATPTSFLTPYTASLRDGDDHLLELAVLDADGAFQRRETIQMPLGVSTLMFDMAVRSAPITSPVLVAMLLPLVMWAAAAAISWFVVDRLLIRPLRRLRTGVDAYEPGQPLPPIEYGAVPAQEIRELGDTFREITHTVERHETNLAEGLVRQTRLTREVHHRVKNNLQVIASLINFHARSAVSDDAAVAYASIQRRVDALAVVHRHHFAEMEENRGLELRAVIGELASNIRATAPPESNRLAIALEVDPLLVSQDVAVAVSFLLTELIELAMSVTPTPQIRISAAPSATADMATLRLSSPTLVESERLGMLLDTRYGRVILGLSRQLRAPLHHDPMVGAYEISIAAKLATA